MLLGLVTVKDVLHFIAMEKPDRKPFSSGKKDIVQWFYIGYVAEVAK